MERRKKKKLLDVDKSIKINTIDNLVVCQEVTENETYTTDMLQIHKEMNNIWYTSNRVVLIRLVSMSE